MLVTAIAVSLCTSQADAQSITGTVVAVDSTTRIGGVIVVASDSTGRSTRALSNASGYFSVTLPHGGRFTLRLLRVGFRPTIAPTVVVPNSGVVNVTLVARAEPVTLAAMSVKTTSECRIRPDTGLLVARVWEEARKAMLASELQADSATMTGEWIEYQRTLDSTGRVVQRQRVQAQRHPTTHVFRSPSADSLAQYGYVVNESDGIGYYAPDAAALLSDAFAATHCFRLVTPNEREAAMYTGPTLGVRFEPTRSRDGIRDIEGTFWVDTRSAELRAIDFTYTNIPEVPSPVVGGGRVEFVRLASGQWIIAAWRAQLPLLGPRDRSRTNAIDRTTFTQRTTVVRSLDMTGGEVGRIVLGDSTVFTRVGPAVRVQFVSPDSSLARDGITIALRGTNYFGTSDSTGTVHFGPLPAGRYLATIVVPQLDSLGAPPIEREVVARVGGNVSRDTIMLPLARVALSAFCPRDELLAGTAMLRGTVRDSRGQPATGAVVTVTYPRVDARALQLKVVAWSSETLGAITNTLGRWQLCGIPHNADIMVRAETDSGADHKALRLSDWQMLATVDLALHRDTTTLSAAVTTQGSVRAETVVDFRVSSNDGTPLASVALEVTAADGSTRTLTTDALGRALFLGTGAGRIVVQAKRIGFKAGRVSLAVTAGRNTAPIILSTVATPTLDTLRVSGGQRVSARLDGFETRRLNHEASASITREEIEKRNPVSAWQMLVGVGAINVIPYGNGTYAMSGRGKLPTLLRHGAPCPMQVMIDGTLLVPRDEYGVNLNDLPPPKDIHGIEVFTGPARVPLPYGGSGTNKWCGLIAIWTRDN